MSNSLTKNVLESSHKTESKENFSESTTFILIVAYMNTRIMIMYDASQNGTKCMMRKETLISSTLEGSSYLDTKKMETKQSMNAL